MPVGILTNSFGPKSTSIGEQKSYPADPEVAAIIEEYAANYGGTGSTEQVQQTEAQPAETQAVQTQPNNVESEVTQ